jgi:ribokinase
MFDIVTFGSAVVDVFVDTNISEKKDFISYPIGSKILIKNLKFDIGGGGTNTAVAFSRFGLRTGYLGKLGDDENGNKILDLLKKEKITFLGKISKEQTGYSIILDSKDGERTILTYKGVNDALAPTEIQSFKTKWLYFSSLLGKSFETQVNLAKSLSIQGVKIAFNPSEYLIKNKNLKSLLKVIDVLILNKEEAELLSEQKTQTKVISALHSFGPRIVVITNKNKEVIASDGIKIYSMQPHKNIKAVERTGAGDAFASGFVAGIIVGKSIEDSLKLGIEESEAVIKYFGAKNNLIRRKLR